MSEIINDRKKSNVDATENIPTFLYNATYIHTDLFIFFQVIQ